MPRNVAATSKNKSRSTRRPSTPSAHVFISYSRKDQRIAEIYFRELRAAGVRIWVDEHSIPGGAQWRQEIARAIRGASAFVLFVSPASVVSTEVAKELELAIRLKRRVIPAFIRPTPLPRRVQALLSGYQFIHISSYRHERVGLLIDALGGLAPTKPSNQSRMFRKNVQFVSGSLAYLYGVTHSGGNLLLKGGREFSDYIQFVISPEDKTAYAEAIGVTNRKRSQKFTPEQLAVLTTLGWEASTQDSAGNFRRMCRIDSDLERTAAASHVVRAFLDAFAHYPGEEITGEIHLN